MPKKYKINKDGNHGKKAKCQTTMMPKMNLKTPDSAPLTTKPDGKIMELKNSKSVARQSLQHLTSKNKTFEDSDLQPKHDDVNKLTDGMGKHKKNLSVQVINKAKPKECNTNERKSYNGSNENYDHNDSKEQHLTANKEQVIKFNKGNLVTIWNYKPSNLKSELANVIALAKQMNLSLSRDQIIDMDVHKESQNSFVYDVYFTTAHVKNEFLKKSYILKEFPDTKSLEVY